MDTEKAFEAVRAHIAAGEYEKVRPITDSIADACGDTYTLLKCASLLRTIDDWDGCRDMLDRVCDTHISDADERLTVAASLRGLGRPEDAYELLKDEENSGRVLREKAHALHMMGRSKEALSVMGNMGPMTADDKILLCMILCSAGEHAKAAETAERLVTDEKASYDSLVNLCAVLMLAGKNNDAVKVAKRHLKNGKDADSLALNAYVMRMNGHEAAAAAYAHRALSADHRHKGALETMAFCLIRKERFSEAKMCAGMINEVSPGHPAAIRILDACHAAK